MTRMRLPNFILMSSNLFFTSSTIQSTFLKLNTTYFTTIEVHNNVRIKERLKKKRRKKSQNPEIVALREILIAVVADRVGAAAGAIKLK